MVDPNVRISDCLWYKQTYYIKIGEDNYPETINQSNCSMKANCFHNKLADKGSLKSAKLNNYNPEKQKPELISNTFAI